MHYALRFVCGAGMMATLGACAEKAASSDEVAAPGEAVMLESPAPVGSSTPSLVTGGASAWLSWTERQPDSTFAIRVVARTSNGWDSVRTVTSGRDYFVNWADFPSVTLLNNGDLAAHWLEREANGKYAYGVRVVRSSDGGRSWSTPVTPHTDGLAAEHGFVTLWADGADGLGLAWLDGRKSAMPDSAHEMTVRTAVVSPDGALHLEALLDARSCDCCQVSSASTRNGRVVVYRDRTSEEIRDIVAVRRTAEGWTAPVTVHDDQWHYPGCPVNGPSVTSRGDTVVVAWFTGAQDTARVLVATSTDGGANFGAPTRVDDGDPIGRAVVVLDGAGDAVVGWMERVTPETAAVRVRRIAHGRMSEARSVATTSSARQSGFPRMTVVGDSLLVSWTSVSPGVAVHPAPVPVQLQVQTAVLPLNSRTHQ